MAATEFAQGRILASIDEGVCRLTLNHAERHNAMSLSMWTDLPQAMAQFESSRDARVVVLTGAGGRAFCAGADISEFGEVRTEKADVHAYDETAHKAIDSIANSRLPVIARIDGVCVGGGMELAMACDIPIASSRSRFGVTPARLGLGYALEDTQLMVNAVGARATLEMLITGKIYDAGQAQNLGLITHVYDADELDAVVDDYAETIAGNAPIAMSSCKSITRAIMAGPDIDREACRALVEACFASEDYKEGQRAFSAKRKPQFKGT